MLTEAKLPFDSSDLNPPPASSQPVGSLPQESPMEHNSSPPPTSTSSKHYK